MKKVWITMSFALFAIVACSQNNMVIINGGYAWANVDASEILADDPNVKGTGWRINGEYAWIPDNGKIAYGIAVGYLNVQATYDEGADPTDYKISTIPMYFAPRYMFGNDKIQGFIKLVAGFHSSTYERKTSTGSLTGNDYGFYGGGGGGLMFHINDRIFLDADYEVAYMTNDYYRNGLMQTIMGGIGIKF
jgi:hypothetical protein